MGIMFIRLRKNRPTASFTAVKTTIFQCDILIVGTHVTAVLMSNKIKKITLPPVNTTFILYIKCYVNVSVLINVGK